MNLQFLWDEVKTRKLLKRHLILVVFGSTPSIAYGFFYPGQPIEKVILVAIASNIFTASLVSLIFINKFKNPGLIFLLNILFIQLATTLSLVNSGGFASILQFVPYALLFLTVFQLGPQSALILSIFTLLNLLGMSFYLIYNNPEFKLLIDSIFYTLIYLILAIIFHNIGVELSLQFEAKKKLEQIDSLKNQFMMITSHYLRTPLTAAKALVNKLENAPLPQEQRDDIEKMETTLTNLDLLIEKFLTVASIEGGQVKISPIESDLGLIVASVVSQYQSIAKERKINLQFNPITEHARFSFDPIMIKEVISNILDNAIKYNRPFGSVNVNLISKIGWTGVLIADTGAGMDQDKKQTLFASFSKGSVTDILNFSNPGLGLSLYLSKLIIDAHKGKIEIQSQVGEGSSFIVWLPIK